MNVVCIVSRHRCNNIVSEDSIEGALFQSRSFYFVTNVTDVTHHSQRFSEMVFLFLLHAAEIPQNNNLRMTRAELAIVEFNGKCRKRIVMAMETPGTRKSRMRK